MRHTSVILGALLAASIFVGPQITRADDEEGAGEGPITLSPNAVIGFLQYIKAFSDAYTGRYHDPYFAVSLDGKVSTYTSRGWENAIEGCEKSGRKCKAFAKEEKVIWKGPVKLHYSTRLKPNEHYFVVNIYKNRMKNWVTGSVKGKFVVSASGDRGTTMKRIILATLVGVLVSGK